MPPAPDDLDLRLRTVTAAERLAVVAAGLETRIGELSARVEALAKDFAAHRAAAEPVLVAHGNHLARLAAAESEVAADAIAAAKSAEERAREAEANARAAAAREQEQRDKARTAAWSLALQVAIPLLAAALGAGGGMYFANPTPTQAQDAPGAAP